VREYHVAPQTINRWLEEGLRPNPNYDDQLDRVRKPMLSDNHKRSARRLSRAGHTIIEIQQHFESARHIKVSSATLNRVLRTGKFPQHWLPKNRGVKLRPENQILRMRFCRNNLHPNFWSWVFIDAKDLYLYPGKRCLMRFCWQDVNKPPVFPKGGTPIVFRFYGAVSHGHKSALYFVPHLLPRGQRLDGARSHLQATTTSA
jgi:hypothetical protein